MNIAATMTQSPIAVTPQTSIDRALEILDEHRIRHLPVVDGGELIGMVSDRDLLEAVGGMTRRVHACRGEEACDGLPRRIADVMQDQVVSIHAGASLREVTRAFVEHRIGSLPVLRRGELVGILTEMDVLATVARGAAGELAGLAEEPVLEHMSTEPVTVPWYASMEDALRTCRDENVRHLPVLEGEHLVGVLSDRDLRRALGAGRLGETPIDELMTRRPRCVQPTTTVQRAAEVMVAHCFGSVPVVQDHALVGILTATDVMRASWQGLAARANAS